MLDTTEWKIALQIYKGHPSDALNLAFQLIAIRQSLERGNKGIPDAIKALDLAVETLYPHTNFHKLGRRLFQQEDLIGKLGVKL